jgi:hypothetical protein
VLVTQNPVDVDYKGLSNAGTWFIGRLQTDQDKQRLLDGLQGAAPGIDRSQYDRMISALGKRVFLLHNINEKGPQLFQTRWAMNYLAGPLTRQQITALKRLTAPAQPSLETPPAGMVSSAMPVQPAPVQPVAAPVQPVQAKPAKVEPALGSTTRPALPTGVREFFLPNNLTFTEAFQAAGRGYPAEAMSQGLIYRPVILAQASIRFFNRKYNLDTEQKHAALVTQVDRRGVVRWENYLIEAINPDGLDSAPDPQARFASIEAPLTDARIVAAIEKDFAEWAFRNGDAKVYVNEGLKQYAGPEVSEAQFRQMCAEAAREQRDAEVHPRLSRT